MIIPGIFWRSTCHSMQNYVRERLKETIEAQDGEHTAEDLLRCFQREATLLLQTDVVMTTLKSDPHEHLDEIKGSVERLCGLLSVTYYEKVQTKTGYCRIAATVQIKIDSKMQDNGVKKYVELYFEYERDGTQNPGEQASAWYSIDVARDDGPKEKVLWVKVFAAGSTPSSLPAKNLDEDEEEGEWEDIDEEAAEGDEEDGKSTEQTECRTKRARLEQPESQDENMAGTKKGVQGCQSRDKEGVEEERQADGFMAGMDPDALEQFLGWTCLGKMQDVTAFFLFMTFPFYEMEFDLPGFVLDAVFGPEDEDKAEEGGD